MLNIPASISTSSNHLFGQLTSTDLASVLLPAVCTFIVGFLVSPWVVKMLHRYQLWRKLQIVDRPASITEKLNKDDTNRIPRMGGLVIIFAVALVTLFFGILSIVNRWLEIDNSFIQQLNFIDRGETWLPFFSLLCGSLIGTLDDLATVGRLEFLPKWFSQPVGDGLSIGMRLFIAVLIGCVSAYWFYFKLENSAIRIPFGDLWEIGIFIIPLLIFTVVATYTTGIIDGADGLSGGVFASIFLSYAIIALLQADFELATFCLVIVGGLLAFLWHNVSPPKFYMSEVGTMALTVTLSVTAFLTNTIFLLPIIALPLVATTASAILQVFWIRVFQRKLFIVSPLHNHFRAKGYATSSVVMRYWIVSCLASAVGLVIYVLGYPNILVQ